MRSALIFITDFSTKTGMPDFRRCVSTSLRCLTPALMIGCVQSGDALKRAQGNPDQSCADDLRSERVNRDNPVLHEIRDTSGGSLVVFIKEKHWNRTTTVEAYIPFRGWDCAHDYVEGTDSFGRVGFSNDSLAPRYHALLRLARDSGLRDNTTIYDDSTYDPRIYTGGCPATPGRPLTDRGRERREIAKIHQQGLREEGCPKCRVWVDGPDNTYLHVLDPQASWQPNDYKLSPTPEWDAGFCRVTYYTSPGHIYADHTR